MSTSNPNITQDRYNRIRPIGKDHENTNFFIIFQNRDCRLYKETSSNGVELILKTYEELESFISKYENSKAHSEINLIKNIKDNLLKFKENDEEEKKRENNLIRKQQVFEKAKKIAGKNISNEKNPNSELYLMNISEHMITRHQLNQITKTTSLNNFQAVLPQPKQTSLSEQDKLKMKIERERIERQKRLEKRQKLMEMNQYEEINEENSEKDEFFIRHKRTRVSNRNSQKRNLKQSRSILFITYSFVYS